MPGAALLRSGEYSTSEAQTGLFVSRLPLYSGSTARKPLLQLLHGKPLNNERKTGAVPPPVSGLLHFVTPAVRNCTQ